MSVWLSGPNPPQPSAAPIDQFAVCPPAMMGRAQDSMSVASEAELGPVITASPRT